jgi:Ca2+-binding RTX toxin-like protein
MPFPLINGTAASEILTDTAPADATSHATLNANWSAGDDTLVGGLGNDTYNVNSAGDVVLENAGVNTGIDTVVSRLSSYTLGANLERLTLDNTPTQLVILPGGGFAIVPSAVNGTGNALDNTIRGNDRDNTLSGLDGDDWVAGGEGNDTLLGGNGADSLYGENGNDTLDGGADNDYLSGGAGDDTLNGGTGFGNDTLNGGAGNDAMSGGLGNDIYYVDAAGDSVIEGAFLGGTDLVYAYVSETLDANVENLTLVNVAAAVSGTGNASANVITGNTFNNVLSGLDGDDTLNAGDGNDSVFGGDGDDTMDGGTGNDYVSGGNGNDTMAGGTGDDTLNGGAGNDAMTGGSGNDVYYIDAVADVAVEAAFGGIDTVYSYITETLNANVENLTLLNVATALNGFGNTSDNVITGNSFGNTLAGGTGDDTLAGGTGHDTLIGGAGLDKFVFANSGGLNDDTISDFSHVDDTIVLSNLLDSALVGALNPGIKGLAFNGGNAPGNTLNAAWYFEGNGLQGQGATNLSGIYVNTFDGEIWYNPTSNVANDSLLLGRVNFAVAPTLDATDFVYGV